ARSGYFQRQLAVVWEPAPFHSRGIACSRGDCGFIHSASQLLAFMGRPDGIWDQLVRSWSVEPGVRDVQATGRSLPICSSGDGHQECEIGWRILPACTTTRGKAGPADVRLEEHTD